MPKHQKNSKNNRNSSYSEMKAVKLWLISSVAIYVIVVLNFMEPFGISNQFILVHHLFLSSYGLVSALTIWLILHWMPKLIPDVENDGLTTKLLVAVLVLLFAVCLSNWLYSQVLRVTISGWHNMSVPVYKFTELMPQLLAIYSLWAIFSAVFIFMLLKNKAKETELANSESICNEMILLPSENQSDGFKVKPAQLVCLKTSDNYLEVFYLNEQEELQHRMIRSSMKKMEERLDDQFFFRPHQSYLVNLAYIKGLKKRQNNHFLEMAYLDFDVAISRKNVRHMKAHVVN